ncbi:MAG: hypothetical protein FJ267_12980 [Planctomycetes bacterium]|nr:hypothetical protein [Planctomycetota bacterium]
MLTVAQDVQVQVLEVIPDRQRISLSLKALKEKPEPAKTEEPEPQTPPPAQRKRKEPLRGGNKSSESSKGGLFGNPDDYR